MASWILLVAAVVLEVMGTTSMKFSDGFARLFPSVLVFVFYGLSIGVLALALKKMEVSVAYAVWSGLGTALIAILGFAFFGEPLTGAKVLALALIVCGAAMLNLTGAH